jgi:hypothetical protein
MSEDLNAATHAASGEAPLSSQPVRLTLLVLAVLGAFEIGRLIAGAVIGPWLAQALLGTRTPVLVGEFDLLRIGVEVLAIAIGVGLAALIAVPFVKAFSRR